MHLFAESRNRKGAGCCEGCKTLNMNFAKVERRGGGQLIGWGVCVDRYGNSVSVQTSMIIT